MSETPLLELENVTKRYPSPGGGKGQVVLDAINLEVAEGESMVIIGPSGSGKSTLLNIMGALDHPTEGTARLEGHDLAGLDEEELSRVRLHKVGFIFQLHHLLPQCTALENVLVPALPDGGGKEAEERARSLLERVGLSDVLDHRPGQLSGGQRQRVAVARALINEPKLLLADEPTGSLDREASENLADLLVELNRDEGVTLITVTHARSLADRLGREMELEGGKLEPVGETS